MRNKKIVLIDFWNTIAESRERDRLWKIILEGLENSGTNRQDFFSYGKEKWFKLNIGKENFIQGLRETFKIGDEIIKCLRGVLDYRNITLINGRVDSLLKLRSINYEIHLVSDCGSDVEEFVNTSELNRILSRRFYSFAYGTIKEEKLYGLVAKELGSNCLMIGDDYKRDYEIPRRYGFDSVILRKTDSLEDLIWKS